tara:strand:- start:2512 stop:2838 length:327 start_codon:yes stop_codon:yes gene_type:complete
MRQVHGQFLQRVLHYRFNTDVLTMVLCTLNYKVTAMANTASPPDMPEMPHFHDPEVTTAPVRNGNPFLAYLAHHLDELSEAWLQRLRLPFGQNAHSVMIGANRDPPQQ